MRLQLGGRYTALIVDATAAYTTDPHTSVCARHKRLYDELRTAEFRLYVAGGLADGLPSGEPQIEFAERLEAFYVACRADPTCPWGN